LPFGLFMFLYWDVTWPKILVGGLIILLTVLLLLHFQLRRTMFKSGISGVIAGLLTPSIGMTGPPLLLYFAGIKTDKAKLRATSIACGVFLYMVSFLLQLTFHSGFHQKIWMDVLISIPVIFLGTIFGQMVFKKLNQGVFLK